MCKFLGQGFEFEDKDDSIDECDDIGTASHTRDIVFKEHAAAVAVGRQYVFEYLDFAYP